MSEKVEMALNRLNNILPLKEKQESCDAQIKNLHQRVLRSFVEKGRILTKDEMSEHSDNLEEAVNVLKNNDMVVFSDNGDPVGAYPFTMEEREHRVRVNRHEVYAMCALDALAVSTMFEMKTQIISKCRVTGEPVIVMQSGKTIENLEETGGVHFGIIWGAASTCSCCADSLCMEMMFLKNDHVAQQWFAEDPSTREIFTLQEAIDFSALFFVPLMT